MQLVGSWRVLVVVLGALSLLATDATMRAQQAVPEVTQEARVVHAWLDTYEQQGEAAAQGFLRGLPTLEPLAGHLMLHGEAWVMQAPSGARQRRALLAATAALDIMHVGFDREWGVLYPLVTWGCHVIRQVPAGSDAERFWHLSSIALMGGGKSLRVWTYLGDERKGHLSDHVLPRPLPTAPSIGATAKHWRVMR